MITAHIHAELIAALFGDDEPCYGECQCVPCRASFPIDTVGDYLGFVSAGSLA
jgi:hypothetical protein